MAVHDNLIHGNVLCDLKSKVFWIGWAVLEFIAGAVVKFVLECFVDDEANVAGKKESTQIKAVVPWYEEELVENAGKDIIPQPKAYE